MVEVCLIHRLLTCPACPPSWLHTRWPLQGSQPLPTSSTTPGWRALSIYDLGFPFLPQLHTSAAWCWGSCWVKSKCYRHRNLKRQGDSPGGGPGWKTLESGNPRVTLSDAGWCSVPWPHRGPQSRPLVHVAEVSRGRRVALDSLFWKVKLGDKGRAAAAVIVREHLTRVAVSSHHTVCGDR